MSKTVVGVLFFLLIPLLYLSLASAEQQDYKVLPEDTLQISVYGEPDLSLEVKVSQQGFIIYPLLGRINVVDLTTYELGEKMKGLLEKDYLVNPQVNILVKQYGSVYLLGQVLKPGPIQLLPNMTVTQAIMVAGGFTKIAAPNKTRLVRNGEGKRDSVEVPIKEILEGKSISKDLFLKPNDMIIVPESLF